jgi:5-methylcytosine-specific restriction endonuclease McrA
MRRGGVDFGNDERSRAVTDRFKAIKSRRKRREKLRKMVKYLVKKQNGLCFYCGQPFINGCDKRRPTFDHVTARSRNGIDHLDNGVAACNFCNSHKGSLTAEEFALTKSNQA